MTELPASFGKYFLTEKLATGGMAEIYLGKLLGPGGFEKQLVIKQIHPRLADERHFVDLFVAEAKTLVGLTHGNIVPVYELGLVDSTYFIAMEYIDGPTLWNLTESVWRAGASLSPPLAAWIAAEILDGLDYAHRKGEGVIHRDLSPRNVMLSRDGQVLLVDFGIAVPFGAGDDPAAEGAPTGSFPYMSPEQVERRRLTPQSDLFSVSALLWEMLARRRLFARENPSATLDAVLHAPIPAPSTFQPEVPARLDELVLRGLERAPEKRWQSAGDFLAALNRYLYALDEPPTARELAAKIGRYCPPVRQSDEHEVVSTHIDEDAREPATVAVARSTEPVVRTESFATHVELQRVFGKTPLHPLRAIRDGVPAAEALRASSSSDALPVASSSESLPVTSSSDALRASSSEALPVTSSSDALRASSSDARPAAAVPARPVLGSTRATQPLPARIERAETRAEIRQRTSWLPLAALATLAVAVVAGAMWLLLHPPGEREGTAPPVIATPRLDARPAPPDAASLDAGASVDAGLPRDAGAHDADLAAPPIDAGVRRTHDAGPRPHPPPPDAGAAPSTGTIKVGADPWGEVRIDGKKAGNAPGTFTVRAGHHVVIVSYPGASGTIEKEFPVDVAAGASTSVFAEFAGGT